MTGGDSRGVADRETRHVPFGLQVPKRLVGLAQSGQEKPERTPIVIDDVVSPGPRIDEFLRVANAGSERAGAAIDPKALARMVLARSSGDLDQPADQSSRRRGPTIANPETLVLGAPRAALEIGDLDCSVRRVLKAIDHQLLAALDLQAGLQGEKHKKRHDIVAREVVTTVEFVSELMRRQSSPRPCEIQVPVCGLIGAEEATFLDNSMDDGFHSRQNRIGNQWPSLLQSSQHGGHVIPCGVTQLARDERAVGIART